MPGTAFTYGDIPVTVEFLTMMRTAWPQRDHRAYRVTVEGPGAPFVMRWDGFPMSHARDLERETEEVAEDMIEALYMALVPEDFWTDAEGRAAAVREEYVAAARRFGDGSLRRSYEEVMRRRRRRERLERAHEEGPKDWRPPLRG